MEISYKEVSTKKIIARDNIMLDLETYGKSAGCPILSIGAVYFDENGVSDQGFYRIVNLQSCLDIGLITNEETVKWWDSQSSEAKEILTQVSSPDLSMPIQEAFYEFSEFVKLRPGVKVWGNGADFDQAIIQYAYAKAGMEVPWDFWNNRCYRTLKSFKTGIKFQRLGTHHNALFDAWSQAEHAAQILKYINRSTKPKPRRVQGLVELVSKFFSGK
jgi:hypothetical protein